MPVIVEGPITVKAALDQMEGSRIRHLIVREGRDHRIVSIRDLIPNMRALDALPGSITAADVMSTPAFACRQETSLEVIVEFIAERAISGIPVVDHRDRVVGVVSERDLAHALGGPLVRLAIRRGRVKKAEEFVGDLARDERRADHVMSWPPIIAGPDASLLELAGLMTTNEINRVPIMSDGRLVGLVTRGDILGTVFGSHARAVLTTRPPIIIGGSLGPGSSG
jgi:CBS domain-containing protein